MIKKQASKAIMQYKNFFYLQLRDNNKNIIYPNKWCFFGGAVKVGENPFLALQRELIEELSFKSKKLIFKFEFLNKETNTNIFFYKLNMNKKKIFYVKEGQKGEWIKKENLKKLNLAPDVFYFKNEILKIS